jgi:putative alpha-1,2-mannosidase
MKSMDSGISCLRMTPMCRGFLVCPIWAVVPAWYILSALGFYAVDSVSGHYVLGSPLVERAAIDLGQGKHPMIETVGNGSNRPYVLSVTWNGKPDPRNWFSHAEIAGGGILSFSDGRAPE